MIYNNYIKRKEAGSKKNVLLPASFFRRRERRLFDFYLFFEVYFVAFAVVYFIFEQGQRLIGNEFEPSGVFAFPLPVEGKESLVDVRCYVRVYV